MNPIASKVWEDLYPDRRPWSKLEPDTQEEWSHMCDIVEKLCADKARLDWLERNLLHLSHNQLTCSVDMGGKNVKGQLVNEARGSGHGPSQFRVCHSNIRQAVDEAMNWKYTEGQ